RLAHAHVQPRASGAHHERAHRDRVRRGGVGLIEGKNMASAAPNGNVGRVVQIIGPVVDVEFPSGHLPTILNAVHITDDEGLSTEKTALITEVAKHLGENRVRCVSMKPADGLVRGMKAVDLGAPISIPVGPETLGRVLNVIGEPVDDMGPVTTSEKWP